MNAEEIRQSGPEGSGSRALSAVQAVPPAKASPRLRELDAIRGIAILLVIGRHTYFWTSGVFGRLWCNCGWAGVDLFFVLSGFLVSGLLFREYQRTRSIDAKRFLIRRGFKIYPTFYVLIALTFIVVVPADRGWTHLRLFPATLPLPNLLSEVFFLQNILPSHWNHTWSLAVEEQFYIALTIGFILVTRTRTVDPFRRLPWFFVAVTLAMLAIRVLYMPGAPKGLTALKVIASTRADSLLFGVVLSYAEHFHRARTAAFVTRFAPLLALCALASFALAVFVDPERMRGVGFTALNLGFGAGLILAMHVRTPLSGRLGAMLAPIGLYSYSIYVWNLPIMFIAADVYPLIENGLGFVLPPWLCMDVFILASVAIGIGMAKLIEIPSLHLRERFFPPVVAAGP